MACPDITLDLFAILYREIHLSSVSHYKAVQVTFDDNIIPKATILDIFFLIHDPTTKNRQGNDIGPQYRSALFYADDTQKAEFESALERAQLHWDNPIVSELAKLEVFYQAEPEHQDYFSNNPGNGYCSVVIAPKINKARKEYAEWFKEDEV